MSPGLLENIKLLLSSYNKFGLKTFESGLKVGENIFISPIGLALAIALLLNGVDQETEDAIRSALLPEDEQISQEIFNSTNKEIIKEITRPRDIVNIDIAISGWFMKGMKIEQGFKKMAEEYYKSELYIQDFTDKQVVKSINSWVKEKTNGKILSIVSYDDIQQSEMNLLLLNVIYFKGIWVKQFDEENTKPEPFYMENGKEKIIQMMEQDNLFLYAKKDALEIVTMTYGKGLIGSTHAYIILPAESITLKELVETLDYNTIMNLLDFHSLEIHAGVLKVPKFTIESKIDLTELLKEQGMEKIFDRNANFSKMTQEQTNIQSILQKTVVTFNEKGTEIATVTEVRGIGGMPPPFTMTVNRPFMVIIIHGNSIKTMLYLGCVYDP